MSNESKKPEATNSQAELSSANRRMFMKSVVTGTVAAGLAASVGKAEAATPTAICGAPEQFPVGRPTSLKVLVNRDVSITLDRLWEIIRTTFEPSGCPNCGLGGIPKDPTGPYPISDVRIELAYMSKDIDSMVVLQESPAIIAK